MRRKDLDGEHPALGALGREVAVEEDRLARRALADEILPTHEIDEAITRSAAELLSAGEASLVANRRQLRVAAEPLDVFRRYMASYAREQAYCFYSPALIDNLERNWEAKRRSL